MVEDTRRSFIKGAMVVGESGNQNHMGNWLECIKSRKTPNAAVEIGYRSAVAAHYGESGL